MLSPHEHRAICDFVMTWSIFGMAAHDRPRPCWDRELLQKWRSSPRSSCATNPMPCQQWFVARAGFRENDCHSVGRFGTQNSKHQGLKIGFTQRKGKTIKMYKNIQKPPVWLDSWIFGAKTRLVGLEFDAWFWFRKAEWSLYSFGTSVGRDGYTCIFQRMHFFALWGISCNFPKLQFFFAFEHFFDFSAFSRFLMLFCQFGFHA